MANEIKILFIDLMRIIKWALSVLLLFVVACAVNPVTGERELMLVSEEQELRIGRESAPSLKWEFGGLYRDSSLEAYLGRITNQLWQNSERPHLPVRFQIQNTSVPNAFALPGYVAITRGLLSGLENEAQFAAVIGHEIGHVMARHTAQRLSRLKLQQLGLAIGGVALEGKSGSDTLLTMGAIGSSLLLLKYSRSQELQADRLGVKYMARLGYDPVEAISAHRALEKSADDYLGRIGKSRQEASLISSLLSTHPEQENRISEIRAMINQLPPYTLKGDGKFYNVFQNATGTMRETNKIYFIYDKAEKYYQEKNYREAEKSINRAIKLDGSQAPFYNLSGFIKLQEKNYPEAKKSYQKALSLYPGYQPSVYGLGLAAFFSKDYKQAINEFRKSLDLYPNHALTHFGLGKSYFHIKQYSKAIPYLRNIAGAAPKHPEIHGLLGICYDNRGEIEPAVIEYRNQLRVAPDTELGQHAKRRLAFLEPSLNQ